jgi:Flp pilus assembly protein TadG
VTKLRRAHHDERGQVGGLEAIPFGILVFVVGSLLAASAWAVVDAKLAVVSAAREAARTYVEADSADEGVEAGSAAAQEAMANHGRRAPVEVTFDEPADFTRCAQVVARVSYEVPAVPLPWIGGLGTTTVSARHSERIDPFRDGIPGEAECPP